MDTTDLPPHDPDRTDTTDGITDPTRSNGDRAAEAADMLVNPASFTEESDYGDFICGLLHLAHSRELDPLDILSNARMHFEAEAGHL